MESTILFWVGGGILFFYSIATILDGAGVIQFAPRPNSRSEKHQRIIDRLKLLTGIVGVLIGGFALIVAGFLTW